MNDVELLGGEIKMNKEKTASEHKRAVTVLIQLSMGSLSSSMEVLKNTGWGATGANKYSNKPLRVLGFQVMTGQVKHSVTYLPTQQHALPQACARSHQQVGVPKGSYHRTRYTHVVGSPSWDHTTQTCTQCMRRCASQQTAQHPLQSGLFASEQRSSATQHAATAGGATFTHQAATAGGTTFMLQSHAHQQPTNSYAGPQTCMPEPTADAVSTRPCTSCSCS